MLEGAFVKKDLKSSFVLTPYPSPHCFFLLPSLYAFLIIQTHGSIRQAKLQPLRFENSISVLIGTDIVLNRCLFLSLLKWKSRNITKHKGQVHHESNSFCFPWVFAQVLMFPSTTPILRVFPPNKIPFSCSIHASRMSNNPFNLLYNKVRRSSV